jgi:hypothetical protein
MNNEEIKKALKLAGKLAIAAEKVINSSAKDVSINIKYMENVLEIYNDHIFGMVESEKD